MSYLLESVLVSVIKVNILSLLILMLLELCVLVSVIKANLLSLLILMLLLYISYVVELFYKNG